MHDPFEGKKPQIDYPCTWDYTLIGTSAVRIQAAVDSILSRDTFAGRDPTYRLVDSHQSSGGRYCSLQLSVTVWDDDQRLRLFEALKDSDAIRFVL